MSAPFILASNEKLVKNIEDDVSNAIISRPINKKIFKKRDYFGAGASQKNDLNGSYEATEENVVEIRKFHSASTKNTSLENHFRFVIFSLF